MNRRSFLAAAGGALAALAAPTVRAVEPPEGCEADGYPSRISASDHWINVKSLKVDGVELRNRSNLFDRREGWADCFVMRDDGSGFVSDGRIERIYGHITCIIEPSA